jgi:hypothetical protein
MLWCCSSGQVATVLLDFIMLILYRSGCFNGTLLRFAGNWRKHLHQSDCKMDHGIVCLNACD